MVFDIVGTNITLKAESLNVPEFKILWNRDKSKEKKTAIDEISFVVFLCDNTDRNPYKNLTPGDRERILVKDFNIKNKDAAIKAAIEKYKILNTTRYERTVQAALKSLEKVEKYYEYVDSLAIEDFDITEVLNSTEKLSRAVKALQELEKQLIADRSDQGRVRGDNEIGDYELPTK